MFDGNGGSMHVKGYFLAKRATWLELPDGTVAYYFGLPDSKTTDAAFPSDFSPSNGGGSSPSNSMSFLSILLLKPFRTDATCCQLAPACGCTGEPGTRGCSP